MNIYQKIYKQFTILNGEREREGESEKENERERK